jgi:carbon-monoxide dehydrogenase medium subunit
VGPIPLKARSAEAFLQGRHLDQASIEHAAELAAAASEPETDLRGSAEYKRDMVRVLTTRALTKALERAGGPAA